jgi:hypothetical protein
MHQIERLGRLCDRQARTPRGRAGQKHDVALDDLRRVSAGERPAPEQRRHLARAAHHHHRLGAQHRSQPPPGGRDDRVHACRPGVEEDVPARDERGHVASARPCEGVAQRVLPHQPFAAHVDRAQQRHKAPEVRRAARRARHA